MKCPLEYDSECCAGGWFTPREMVKHWREVHQMLDVTSSVFSNGNVATYQHRLALYADGLSNKTISCLL
jgi:hypothetical protein